MKERAEVGLGDLARCLRELEPADERSAGLIAGMLGLRLETAEPALSPGPASGTGSRARREDRSDEAQPEVASSREQRSQPAVAEASLPRLAPAEGQRRSLSAPWRAEPELESFDPARHLLAPPRRLPLFDERWSRELLTALLATQARDGPIDEQAAVDRIARGQPPVPLRRLVRASLRRGAQLLVDVGEAMQPFTRDAWDLADQVERIAGVGGVSVQSFWDAPQRGMGPMLGPYLPPSPSCPVLVLSDVGIGGPPLRVDRSQPKEWLDLEALLRARGSPLIVLVPYRRARWPTVLQQRLMLIEWDRTTTAARAYALQRTWHGKQPG
jgi:hypothetical protein